MKIIIYNIAYGTGSPGGEYRRLLTGHRYLAAPERPFRKIAAFLSVHAPDVVGLVETDLGSRRTHGLDQAGTLARALGLNDFGCRKYGPDSPLCRLPYLKHQGNALLTADADAPGTMDFFPCGTKKLILIRKVAGIFIVLVHLALTRKVRRRQLEYLVEILPPAAPTVVAGDFNTFGGERELAAFTAACGLRNANLEARPTYPAWKPQKQLDYLLLSPEVRLDSFDIPHVCFSDHLPLVAELSLTGSA